MTAPNIPPEYMPIEKGLFALRGGPLCGLTTDVPPVFFVIPLVWIDPSGRVHLTEYRWCPDDLLYDFTGEMDWLPDGFPAAETD